jgi:CBS domain-containing protein
MAATGYRHVPVVDLEQRLVGVVSPKRVTAFLQTYFQDAAG